MLYNVLQVFMVDWIKFGHAITIDFEFTLGRHISDTWHGGGDCLSNFLNFVSEEGGKLIAGPGG